MKIGKQETLEEAAEKEFPLLNTKWCRTGAAEEENLQLLGHRNSFIKGAIWQKKRSYSEEEVLDLINLRTCDLDLAYSKTPIHYLKTKEWFEQFKKK